MVNTMPYIFVDYSPIARFRLLACDEESLLRNAAGVVWYRCLNSFMKCEMFENAHSAPISDTVRPVEDSRILARSSRFSIIQRCGGVWKRRRNSFLNDVNERCVRSASVSIDMS